MVPYCSFCCAYTGICPSLPPTSAGGACASGGCSSSTGAASVSPEAALCPVGAGGIHASAPLRLQWVVGFAELVRTCRLQGPMWGRWRGLPAGVLLADQLVELMCRGEAWDVLQGLGSRQGCQLEDQPLTSLSSLGRHCGGFAYTAFKNQSLR